ncbi:hypothetical protein RF11_06926 [Thelohanellus kitauei]|uniref:Uncharacterized protein n=1 Tax=Thelohanellus kitauei TaxID=669202 RepID=A0A0C2JGT3_THEKT|nr:hypothetical protein RF11_06926 [Thelohanellus kitauei]
MSHDALFTVQGIASTLEAGSSGAPLAELLVISNDINCPWAFSVLGNPPSSFRGAMAPAQGNTTAANSAESNLAFEFNKLRAIKLHQELKNRLNRHPQTSSLILMDPEALGG